MENIDASYYATAANVDAVLKVVSDFSKLLTYLTVENANDKEPDTYAKEEYAEYGKYSRYFSTFEERRSRYYIRFTYFILCRGCCSILEWNFTFLCVQSVLFESW